MPPTFSIADFSDALTAYLIAHPVVETLLIVVWIGVAVRLGQKVLARRAITRQIHQIADLGRKSDEAHLAWLAHLQEQDAEARRIHRLVHGSSDPTKAA